MIKFLLSTVLILLFSTYTTAFSRQQTGTSGSATSYQDTYKLQSIIGQTAIGNSGDLKSGFLYRNIFPIYIPGDANGDSEIDISDSVFIISYIFNGGSAPEPLANGDADCSGKIDISDAVFLISFIFNGGGPPEYCP